MNYLLQKSLIPYCQVIINTLLPWNNNTGQMPSIQDWNNWKLQEFLVNLIGEYLWRRH